MGKLAKIAVIGTGWWSTQAHIPALMESPRAEAILIDRNPQALERAASSYDIPHKYTSLQDALHEHPDIQGAVVAVSHRAHYEAAREVLESGLHLLLEKPMTLFAWEAKALIDLAAAKGLQILVGYTYPYDAPAQAAKKRIDDGLLGELHYITCHMSSMTIEFLRGTPDAYRSVMNYPVTGPSESTYSDPQTAGGGQAQLQITHSAGLMFYLAPELRAKTVSAYMSNLDAKVDVADAIAARMTNGAVATIGSTGNIATGDGGIVEVHLHGDKGRLLIDAISGLVYMRLHDGREERIEATYPPYPAAKPMHHFIEMILDGAPNFLPGETVGLHTVELIDAAYRSAAQEGVPVEVASLYAD